jgi:hypothetical protein
MSKERTRVAISSTMVHFPSVCPKCLGKTDLTHYNLKGERSYLKDKYSTVVKEKFQVNVPICSSCKETLISSTRKTNAKMFAILTPIIWALTYVLFAFFGAASWPSIGVVILILVAASPIGMLWFVVDPSQTVNWPVKFVTANVFSVENGTYARLLVAANPV